jgi:DNA polymerase-3 subunit epsilon
MALAFFANCHWACSAMAIDWKAHGLARAASLICSQNAVSSTTPFGRWMIHAVLRYWHSIFRAPSKSGLAVLLDRALRPQYRIWVDGAPFALKDTLKWRGYRCDDGTDGRPKASGAR